MSYKDQAGPYTAIDLTGDSDSELGEGNEKPTMNIIYISSSSSSDNSSEDSSDDKDVQPKPVRKTASTILPIPPKELLHIRPGDTVHFWNHFGIAGRSGDMLKEVVREVRSAEAAKGGWVLRTVGNNLRTLDQTVALPSINPKQYRTLVKVSNYTLHPGKLPSKSVAEGMDNHIKETEKKMKEHAQKYMEGVKKRVEDKKQNT
jgi:hypothetical protein